MNKKDKRPTRIYPDHREKPEIEPPETPADDVILTEPTQPPII